MDDILGEVDANVPARQPVTAKQTLKIQNRRKIRVLSPPAQPRPQKLKQEPVEVTLPETPPAEIDIMNDELPPLGDDGDATMSDPLPSSPTVKAAGRALARAKVDDPEEDDEDMMEISKAVAGEGAVARSVTISGHRPVPKEVKKPALPTPESSSPPPPRADAIDPSVWKDVTANLNVLSSPAQPVAFGKLKVEEVIESDGSLRFFWMDYTEVNGSLCLFGKVQNKTTGSFASAFIKVDNILRKLFFLPQVNKGKLMFVVMNLC